MSVRSMMSTGSLDHNDDDGRCRRLRRRRYKFVDVRSLAILVAVALFAQQTSGVGGELAAAADRKSRKRQSSVLRELSSVEDDPYETDVQTYSNITSNRRAASADRHHFEFVNPKPGKLRPIICACLAVSTAASGALHLDIDVVDICSRLEQCDRVVPYTQYRSISFLSVIM